MAKQILTSWQRLVNLLKLDRKDVLQVFYYAIFSGLVGLSLPLGIQAIINLIQGAQVSTSWIILVILVTLGVAFSGVLQLMQIRIIENIQQCLQTRLWQVQQKLIMNIIRSCCRICSLTKSYI